VYFTDLMIEPYQQMAKILPRLNAAGVKLLIVTITARWVSPTVATPRNWRYM